MEFLLSESRSVGSRGGSSSSSFGDVPSGVIIIAAIVALIVAIVLFVTIVQRKKAPRGKFLKWLREYLNFRSILVSGIIKFVYMFFAVFLTIMSIVVMCQGRDETVLPMIGAGLAMMIFGNILLRIMLEMTMALIVVWENTSDIRSVLVKDEEKLEEKKPETPKAPKEEKEKPVIAEAVAVEETKVEVSQPEAIVPETPQPEVPQPEV